MLACANTEIESEQKSSNGSARLSSIRGQQHTQNRGRKNGALSTDALFPSDQRTIIVTGRGRSGLFLEKEAADVRVRRRLEKRGEFPK
ncbi:hypothetical protein NDU88_003342 [Pleurodeles waltl]|uniref:Uncharacterized protein n=1 Tax=Pleurodeles waltl TaxID=8319 RepID=A0AAV7MS61_PLEWA|nr:hypothetical protein NDU88_003342 [Pleurodeles waltl]